MVWLVLLQLVIAAVHGAMILAVRRDLKQNTTVLMTRKTHIRL